MIEELIADCKPDIFLVQEHWLTPASLGLFNSRFNESHTRTVVRECCKDDDQSQWERPKFDPPPHLNPLTDRHQNLPT